MTSATNTHPGQLCRLCAQAQESGELTFLFSDEEDQDNLADIININLPVKVSQKDPLPKQICQLCLEKLRASHEFALSCVAAEQELQSLHDEEKFTSDISSQAESKDAKVTVERRALFESEECGKVCTEDQLLSEIDCFKQKKSEQLSSVVEDDFNLPVNSYQCPLCCEGDMLSCLEDTMVQSVQCKSPIVQSFEEELMALHSRVNEEDDSSLSVVEEESDVDDLIENIENVTSDTATLNEEGTKHLQVKQVKKQKRLRGKKKRRIGRKSKLASQNFTRPTEELEESDSLIWIKADNEQSIPLVQCIHCSGWLPGYASCLQHSLTSHIDVNEDELKIYHCSRCEGVSVSSSSDLISHFKSTHCPNHEFEVEEEDGQFIVTDKSVSKVSAGSNIERDISYYCCICERGFSWLLDLLRHSCSQVDCNEMYCHTCNQDYRNRQRFVFHMNFHSAGAPPLECDVCNESFADDCLLYNHVRFAHSTENFVCNECGRYFRSEKGLASHQMSAHSSDPSTLNRHRCTVCGKYYRDKQGLKEHLVTHMSEKPFPCDKCERAYNRYSRLKQHQMSHVYSDAMECLECINCGLAFADAEKAQSHSKAEHHEVQSTVLNKIYRCEFCDTVFSCPDGLNMHRPSHVGDKPYVCHICGASFHTYSRVTTHKTTHGIYDQIEPLEGDFTIPRYFLCEHCGVSYPYWSYLQTHRKMRHSENPYALSCKLCPEKFKNSWSVIYHRKKVHDQNGDVKEWRKRTLQCPHCGVNCMYQHTLSMHIERKHGSLKDDDGKRENYQCEECGKVFKYQSSLLLHQKMHQGHKNFQCEECSKSFLTIATLRNHTKRCHQGIKPHQCEFCGKAFFHRVTRDDHLRVHTGEKPFKCQFCDKRFRLKSMLADHAKIHNDHRPYPCDVCGSSFRRMVHMKQHRMLHTGEKPFQCRCCGQDFRLKQELQRHMKTKHVDLTIENVDEDEFIFGDS